MRTLLLSQLLLMACRQGSVKLDSDGSEANTDQTTEQNTVASDADNDGYSVDEGDCDDQNAAINPAADEVANDGIDQDCDGDDRIDVDEDGFAEDEDCNDEDSSVYPGAPEDLGDGVDQDCDGIDLDDADNDGWLNDVDCDDQNPNVYPDAAELCDGFFNDCNNEAWSLSSLPAEEQDADNDGYIPCDYNPELWFGSSSVAGGLDCDDADSSVYPGAPETPSDGIDQDCDGSDIIDNDGDGWLATEDCDDNDASMNYADNDGDGYPSCEQAICVTIDMADSYGDGWNGGYLSAYENGVWIDEYAAADYGSSIEHCMLGSVLLELYYTAYEYEEENSYTVNNSAGEVVFSDGPYPQEGLVYSYQFNALADCDDDDPEKSPLDADQDGYSSCDGDCNDSHPLYNLDDMDQDGESSCDGDCDDSDVMLGSADIDGDGFGRCTEACYDIEVVDNWGDGWTDSYLTLTVEGYEWAQYTAIDSGQIESFCIFSSWDFSLNYTAGSWEQDNSYSLVDATGEVIFSDGPSPAEGNVFSATATGETDCDDHNTSIYPGAPEIFEDGIDQDCNGVDLVDADGDGSNNDTDCDDSDPNLNWDDLDGDGLSSCEGDCLDSNPNINWDDVDGDGFSTCELDCNDSDSSLHLYDYDGDGFSTCAEQLCYTIEMIDSYGDGWNGGFIETKLNQIPIDLVYAQGSASSETICFPAMGDYTLHYTTGDWEEENTYSLYDEAGNVLQEGGPYISAGVIFSSQHTARPDCNDGNLLIHPDASDVAGDGTDQNCDGVD